MSFDFEDFTKSYISNLINTLKGISKKELKQLWIVVEGARNNGKTIHLIGNGGSAGTPSHSAGDWSKELALKTISHMDNLSS